MTDATILLFPLLLVLLLLLLGLRVLLVYWCYKIAESKGRSAGFAVFMGILFGVWAVIGYYIVKPVQEIQIKNAEELLKLKNNKPMETPIINPANELMAGPKRNLPRDVFLHLFAMVTLYWSAISVITLCWQYVNYFFPDLLNYGYNDTGAIRFAVSSLVIVFPLFMLTSWLLNKIYAKEAQVRESKVRKWLIYLTLFVAALVILGDLIYVINTFLGGEITVRFILKALSIIVVTGVIFWYYLDDVRRSAPSNLAKLFAIVTSIVVLILFIGAFFIIGSPQKARQLQFDTQRTNDLQSIQYQIVNYWQTKGTMPAALADLTDSISGYTAPTDPETQAPYEYSIKDAPALSFQLCTTFDLPSVPDPSTKPMAAPAPYPYQVSQNWNHAAGHFCFDRTIDKQLYPPIKK